MGSGSHSAAIEPRLPWGPAQQRVVPGPPLKPDRAMDAPANGSTEANHVSVRVGDEALPLVLVVVPPAVHSESHLSPLLSYGVSVLAVDVTSTVTGNIVSAAT